MKSTTRLAGRIRRQVLSIALLAALIPTAAALAEKPDEAARKEAEELMKLTNVEQTLADVRGQIDEMMAAQLNSLNVPEHLKGKVAAHQKKVSALVAGEMSYPKMREAYIDTYVSTFSAEELSGLVAFYKSPVGKAFVDKQPELMKKIMMLSQERMQKIAPQVQKLNAELVAELQKDKAAEKPADKPAADE
jgi:hypothetical protein